MSRLDPYAAEREHLIELRERMTAVRLSRLPMFIDAPRRTFMTLTELTRLVGLSIIETEVAMRRFREVMQSRI